MRIILFGVVFLSILIVSNSAAENREGAITVSPVVGGYYFDKDYDLENNPNLHWGFGLGYNMNQNWAIEALLGYMDTESDKGGDVKAYRYKMDSLYHFTTDNPLVPYLATGLGAITLDPDLGGKETNFLINYGGGLKIFVNESFALRGDVRQELSLDDIGDKTKANFVYSLGASFLLGGKKAAPAEITKRDSDGDGVDDDKDKCPGTPSGCPVDSSGCPLDSDGDGVIDCQDKCPDTPKGCKVDSSGCSGDSDGDGVNDCMDKCPNTPKGAVVDERGCWVVTGAVLFDFDKYELKQKAIEELDRIVNILNQDSDLKVEVQGHTDNVGTAVYNKKLSEKRAGSVKTYLVNKGISSDRLTIVGFGFMNPAVSNETAEGRAKNRRVEFKPVE